MNETGERRYLDKLIYDITERFSSQSKSFELQDIVQFIVGGDDSPFDLGFFFLHDQVQNSFFLGGVYPEEHKGTTDDISEKMEKIDCELDSPELLKDRCGLFLYIARNFKKDCMNKDKIYLAINDLKKFRRRDPISRLDIDMDSLPQKIQSKYYFPVFIKNDHAPYNKQQRILHAVVVLLSYKKNNIQKHDLRILSNLISFIITVEARKIANTAFYRFVDTLSDFEDVKYARTEYEKIITGLKEFYSENPDKKTLKQVRIKHASLWTLNDTDISNIFLVKEKNFDFPGDGALMPNIITGEYIGDSGMYHYFYQFITLQLEKIKNNKNEFFFDETVQVLKFSEISEQFYNRDNFKHLFDISDDDIVVLIPIFPNIKKGQIALKNIGLMTLYFDKNTLFYYFNIDFLELMSHKIHENMQIVISKAREEIRRSIFEDISTLHDLDESISNRASTVIKKILNTEYCLIYLFDEERAILEIKSMIEYPTFPKKIVLDETKISETISDIFGDEEVTRRIVDYLILLKNKPTTNAQLMLHEKCNSHQFLKVAERGKVYAAMLMPIKVAKNPVSGVMICLNIKRTINKSTIERSFFSLKDYEIVSIGAESIAIFVEIFKHAGMYKKLLRRLAHEIPNQSSFIMQNVMQLKEEFDGIVKEIKNQSGDQDISKFITDYKRVLFQNILMHQYQAAFRVQLFSEYTRWEKLDKININKEQEIFYINQFLSSIIEGLRLNAEKGGVFAEFDIISHLFHIRQHSIEVHPFFSLAVWNLINNAIQYSYFGTNVRITFEEAAYYQYFHVENIGVAIPQEIRPKIFLENFRGTEAKKKFFKSTGFGLSLVKKVVEAHGGSIEIEARNDIFKRNIFGLFEIEQILKNMKSEKDKKKFINRNAHNEKQLDDFTHEIKLSHKEQNVFREFERFSIHFSDRSKSDLVKNYLYSRLNGFESLCNIFDREVNVPMSYVRFSVILPKNMH